MAAFVSIPLQQHLVRGFGANERFECFAKTNTTRKNLDSSFRLSKSKFALVVAAFALPIRRRRDEGRIWQTASRQDSETILVEGEIEEKLQQNNELRFGVTDSFMLSWISRRLHSFFPDVQFSGMVLANEVGGCGPEQLANLQGLLESEEVDFMVLPAKDVAFSLPSGLSAAAILREDSRDAVVVRPGIESVTSLSDLPPGSTVCVSCARRRLQISSRFPALNILESNLPAQSRLRRLYSLDFDAVVAAVAGLQRTGLSMAEKEISPLKLDEVMPALCQGAVTMLCRSKDEEILSLLADCDDDAARLCIVAERDLLRRLGRLPDGAAVGGLAQLWPDGRLSMQSTMVFSGADAESPRVVKVDMDGSADDWQALTKNVAHAFLSDDTIAAFSLVDGQEPHSRARSHGLADDTDDTEEDPGSDNGAASEALAAIGAADRIPVSDVDGPGRTAYRGRVCGYLANRNGLLVDINCEFPAFWYPEHASSSSSSPEHSDWEELWPLGSDVEVYCCAKHAWFLRVVAEPPLRLPVRGGIPRLKLEQLQPGQGPWRAVVISSTRDGTLVDFNCEMPGLLQSDRFYVRGEEARVYCMKVDKENRVCVVSTAKELLTSVHERRKLEDLASEDNSTGLRGTVLNVTGNGVFIDVNCEVRGYVSPMDIDLNASPNGLYKGFEVTVYIKSVHLEKRQVRLSMFPTREPVKILGLKQTEGLH